jgi:hypothetical protein
VVACALALPAAAQAGVGGSTVPAFPSTVTVGDTGVPASIAVSNRNDGAEAGALNTVCNAGDPLPCPAGQRGITLTPACSQLGADSACAAAGAEPGVLRVSSSATGVAGTTCSGMTFTVAQVDTTFGLMSFTPDGGQHVSLLGGGATCRIAFTFDVLKSPNGDQNNNLGDGRQTAQSVESLQWAPNAALTGFGRGTSAGTTVLRAQPAIATTASPSVTLGGQISDTAVVTGRVNPVAGATVDFRLFGPDDATCAGNPIFQSAGRPVDADGRAASEAFTPTVAGTYRWVASYSGDANNAPVSGACNDANENVVVTPPPRTSTQSTPPNAVRPPRIGVSDVPGQGGRCTGSNFKLKVNARATGLKSVRVTLDGKTIARSKKAKFTVRVRAAARKFGRHVIRIIANGAGGRTVRVLEFRRCGRPVQPRFVGSIDP